MASTGIVAKMSSWMGSLYAFHVNIAYQNTQSVLPVCSTFTQLARLTLPRSRTPLLQSSVEPGVPDEPVLPGSADDDFENESEYSNFLGSTSGVVVSDGRDLITMKPVVMGRWSAVGSPNPPNLGPRLECGINNAAHSSVRETHTPHLNARLLARLSEQVG